MAWKLTDGLQNLRSQVNAAFPARDKGTDGTIGDAAHQAGTSGHNPDDSPGNAGDAEWDGDADSTAEVRAWDMDADLRTSGVTAQKVVDHIRGLPGVSSVLRYIIFNRKIYRSSNGWKAETYTGSSPHTEHIHFSGARSQASDNNTSFDYRLEDLVALTDADINKIADAVWDHTEPNPQDGDKPGRMGGWIRLLEQRADGRQARLLTAIAAGADKQAIVAGVLAGLSPQAIAAAIPADLAKRVADELAARLAA